MNRLHRLLLRMHPRSFREEFGNSIEEMLALRAAEVRARGPSARIRFWLRESLGLLTSMLRERALRASSRRYARWVVATPSPNRIGIMEQVVREIRHAVRRLVRAPAFTLASLVTLALAIGANAAIFTLVHRVVLAPLPYADSERLVLLDHGARGLDRPSGLGITTGLYSLYMERSRALESIGLYQELELTLSAPGEPERIRLARMTPSTAEVLRLQPQLGRWFDAKEGELGGPVVAVLSYALWMRRFGGDASIVGKTFTLGDTPTEIIGVMPADFAFPNANAQLWIPYRFGPQVVRAGGFNFVGIARLRHDVNLEDARVELDQLIAQLPELLPGDPIARSMIDDGRIFSSMVPLKDAVLNGIQRTLWILLGAVGVVLLIACANVANLFLVRSEGRQREVAVRRALGAGRSGIAGFYLGESVLLALVGGVLGLALASAGVRFLISFGPQTLPRLNEVRIDAVVAGFTALLSFVAALAFGSIPLLRRGRTLSATLHESGRANTPTAARMRVRHLLMGGQVALALVLLVASALMGKSFQHLLRVDPGFDASSALRFDIGLSSRDYADAAAVLSFHHRLRERIATLPGVTGVAITTCPPLQGNCWGDPLAVDGRAQVPGQVPPIVSIRTVMAGYFQTMRIRHVAGRLFEPDDFEPGRAVAVIDERLAQLYFPGEDPLGKRVSPEFFETGPNSWFTIVGVVSHVATNSLSDPNPPPQLYVPVRRLDTALVPVPQNVAYIVRTETPPLGALPALRRTVEELDPNVALARVGTLESVVAQARAPMAFLMNLLAFAGGAALILGLIGIYGVITYAVAQRTGEIGVRIALGARPRDVALLILRQAGTVTVVGVALGLAGAFAATRLMRALLFGITPTDPTTFAGVAISLLAIALLACWLPARRAARLDPIAALRAD
jgi:predicted permease